MSLRKIVAFGVLCLLAQPLFAQDYPTRPIRVIVPYAPGGGSDILARLLQQKTSEELGQQLVVDNRAGAASTLGTQLIAHAVPDGYTIGMIRNGKR